MVGREIHVSLLLEKGSGLKNSSVCREFVSDSVIIFYNSESSIEVLSLNSLISKGVLILEW